MFSGTPPVNALAWLLPATSPAAIDTHAIQFFMIDAQAVLRSFGKGWFADIDVRSDCRPYFMRWTARSTSGMKRSWLICLAFAAASIGAARSQAQLIPPPSKVLPPEVEAFIRRDANCHSKHPLDRKGQSCSRLNDDRASLRARYRRDVDVQRALTGHWGKVVKRL